jgi:hypothetical protein
MISALVGHLVGDYLLQNDWMALNKKRDSWPCLIHCSIWTACVVGFAQWPLWTIVPLFVTHFIQDRTQIIKFWMTKVNRQSQFAEPPMAPWSIIVVDQCWHIVILWAISRWI